MRPSLASLPVGGLQGYTHATLPPTYMTAANKLSLRKTVKRAFPQRVTCHVRPLETCTASNPFCARNASTAASASDCFLQGEMVLALVCQYQNKPVKKTASCGTKY